LYFPRNYLPHTLAADSELTANGSHIVALAGSNDIFAPLGPLLYQLFSFHAKDSSTDVSSKVKTLQKMC